MKKPEEDPKSVNNSDAPALVVRKLKGQRWGWPVASLSEWYYNPAVTLEEGAQMSQVEELVLLVGLRRVRVMGIGLERIATLLELGAGATLTEQGRDFVALAKDGGTFVAEIRVELGDDALPGAE